MKNNDVKNKYIACMILHALGDTIGYKNSEWEFMDVTKLYTNPIYLKPEQFIHLGGITQISLKDWIVSDDTILHIQTAKGLLDNFKSINSLCEKLSEYYIKALEQFEKEGYELRMPGNTTIRNIKKLRDGTKWDQIPYNFGDGGSGASMRNLCIGLAYYGKNNRDKLIQVSIESSRITHNSATGYLGGFASALFVALAVEKVPIQEWMFHLLDSMDKVKKYIESVGRDFKEYSTDSHTFIKKIKRYVEIKFNYKREVIKRRTDDSITFRIDTYQSEFASLIRIDGKLKKKTFIGSGGDDSIIIAYDSLLDAGNNWEKLIYYAMLHIGDTDTTGCIAGGLYGILYGFENVPQRLLEYLEYKKELESIGVKLFEKYYKS